MERPGRPHKAGSLDRNEYSSMPKTSLPYPPHMASMLQRTIGNRATGRLLERTASASSKAQPPAIQRKLKNVASDTVDSPAGAISTALGGIAVGKMTLPGSQPASQQERPKKVEAEVKEATLRDSDRNSSSNLSKVTTMARAEQVLLQGADVKKFYDAGHLVADQLVGKKEDSFTMWNLAPQSSEFNAPAYAQVMEEEVKRAAKAGSTVKVEVEVGYPDGGTYTLKVSDILKRGVASWSKVGTTHVKIGSKLFPVSKLDETVSIPRRIPDQWKMDATVIKGDDLPAAEKPASPGENAAKSVPADQLGAASPTIGNPYAFAVSGSTRTADKLKLDKAKKRTLIAKQWAPTAGDVRADDVASLVSSTFPDLGNKDAIIEKLTTDGGIVELLHNAADGVSSRLNEAMLRMTKVMDPTLLESDIVDYNEKVEALLKNSEAARSQRDLKGAVDFLVRAQQLVDDMNEAIAEADKQQRDEYVFPLSVMEKLRKNREEFETPKVREPSPLSEAKRTFAGGSYELLYTNQTGGEFRFFHFSVPADINEPIWIGSPLAQQPMVVIAAQVFQEEPGLWHIRFRFPGAFGM